MGLQFWALPTHNCCQALSQGRSSSSVQVHHKRRSSVTAIKRLQLSRASVIGAVLTKYDAKTTGYGYDYGYGYGRGDRYGADAKPRGLSVRILGGSKQQPQLTDTHVSG